MIKLKGRYTEADIFADVVEQAALDQIQTLCDQPFAENSHIAVMPDVHAGAGCTIGTTMTIDTVNGKVCPNLVGVDIGCGMNITELGKIDIDFAELDAVIHALVPAGQAVHPMNAPADYPEWENRMLTDSRQAVMRFLAELNTPINAQYELARIGTLGGGNHFIEVDADEDGNKYLVIHSGSRHLGVAVCSYFMEIANSSRLGSLERHNQEKKEIIARMKAAGREREIASTLAEFDRTFVPSEPSPLAYVENDDLLRYLSDMKLAQWFAEENRNLMANIICTAMEWMPLTRWETVHNYIDLENGILRKGAISLLRNEQALIPISMKEGALIVKGKGNPSYNFSGPHGAGRLMGRSEARATLSMEKYRKAMAGIWTTSVSEKTLDESPLAYKGLDDILPSLEPTAEVVKHILSMYSFKAQD